MAEHAITDEVEVRCGVGAMALFVLTAVVQLAGPTGSDAVALFLSATVLLALLLDRVHALFLGVTGWALATGFVVNTAGELTLAPPDLARLAAFVMLAAAVGHRTRRW
jgi:uncharacterized membrane protein YhhN